MRRESGSRLPWRGPPKRMVAVLVSSSLAVGLLVAFDWDHHGPARRPHSRLHRPPRGVFRELLGHSSPAANRSSTRNPDFRENLVAPAFLPLDGEKGPPSPAAGGGWTVVSGDVAVHLGNVSNPHNYSYILRPHRPCRTFRPDGRALLIFVESRDSHLDRRRAIRETWGSLSLQRALNFRVVFGLGVGSPSTARAVSRESYRHDDLLQENFPESFRNLALKSVMGLKWAVEHCPRADYIMKTDDDLLIHVPNLLKILEERPTDSRTVLCHQNRVRRILRKEILHRVPAAYGKYAVESGDLPGRFFPPYCAGMGYVFSRWVARELYQAARVTPYFFIEDVYITGFCRHKARVGLSDHPAIALKPAVLPGQGGCAFKEGRVTSQEIGHFQMRQMWRELNTRGSFCPEIVGYVGRPGAP